MQKTDSLVRVTAPPQRLSVNGNMPLRAIVGASDESTDPVGNALLKGLRFESTSDSANHMT